MLKFKYFDFNNFWFFTSQLLNLTFPLPLLVLFALFFAWSNKKCTKMVKLWEKKQCYQNWWWLQNKNLFTHVRL